MAIDDDPEPIDALLAQVARIPAKDLDATWTPPEPDERRPTRPRWPWLVAACVVAGGVVALGLALCGGDLDRHAAPPPLVVRDPARFDLQGFLPAAMAHARAQAADAALVEIQLHPLDRGVVDLSRRGAIENRIVFVSKGTQPCAIVIVLTEHGAAVERRDEPCALRPVRPPVCRIDKLPGAQVATSIRYAAGPGGPRWHIAAFPADHEVDDDCGIDDTDGR